MDDPSCAITPESDIESSAYAGNRYQLRQRKPCVPIQKTRSSNRLKQTINYLDNSDKDSDYKPKPKRVRNPNVGLENPLPNDNKSGNIQCKDIGTNQWSIQKTSFLTMTQIKTKNVLIAVQTLLQ